MFLFESGQSSATAVTWLTKSAGWNCRTVLATRTDNRCGPLSYEVLKSRQYRRDGDCVRPKEHSTRSSPCVKRHLGNWIPSALVRVEQHVLSVVVPTTRIEPIPVPGHGFGNCSAPRFGHWSVEANHHVLGMTFDEDRSRIRNGHGPASGGRSTGLAKTSGQSGRFHDCSLSLSWFYRHGPDPRIANDIWRLHMTTCDSESSTPSFRQVDFR